MLPVNEITQHKLTWAVREGLGAISRVDYGPVAVQISAIYKHLRKARAAVPQRGEASPEWRAGPRTHSG